VLKDIAPYVIGPLFFLVIHYVIDAWQSRAPAPDGLYPGEKLIAGVRASLRIDNSVAIGLGFAYLTELRLVWTPQIGGLNPRRLGEGPYGEPVIVEFPEIRKVDVGFRFGGSSLIVETSDIRLEFLVDGRSLRSWERYLGTNARNLLPKDQPVLRVGDRYSRVDLAAASRGTTVLLALFLILVSLRLFRLLVDIQGDSLSETQLLGIAIVVCALALAAFAWENRSR
jgi:hypothetical protein